MHVIIKWLVILADRFGPEILTLLEIKDKFCIVCVCISWLVVRPKCALTKKSPVFLSRLNEKSGGRWNMFSFGIIAESFEVFENNIFDCKVLWMVGADEWNSVGFFALWRLQCSFSVDFLGAMFACGYSGVSISCKSKSHWRNENNCKIMFKRSNHFSGSYRGQHLVKDKLPDPVWS